MAHWRKRIALPGPSWDSLLILTSSAVRYGLHERLLVQTAQADEVKRSAHAQGMRHHLIATASQFLTIDHSKAEVFKV